ncbi:MAG TPA: hypothetical protein VE134_00505 [Methanomicrobiales archaeon]|nr:hypothetical protein [Methanomicrobiales archaeon]
MCTAVASASEPSASQVAVTAYQVEPSILMRGDTGTIAITVTNSGTEGVALTRAKLSGEEIRVTADPYQTVGLLGPGTSKTFTFSIKADTPEGIYYPVFLLDFRDAGQLRYPLAVRVESSSLQVSLLEKPTYTVQGEEGDYRLLIGNPRDNGVNGVRVTPVGDGFSVAPSGNFLGTLEPDQSAEVTFHITPESASNVTFLVTYLNGINQHQSELTLPLAVGENRRQAELILTNVEISPANGAYRLTGDISNAGLETANAVVVRMGDSVTSIVPYKRYVVGTLNPDDFSSFELSFQAEGDQSLPVMVEFKDEAGNLHSSMATVAFTGSSLTAQSASIPWPFLALTVVLAVAIGGAILYSWKRSE